MKRMRNFRLPLVVATTLGILAACDVSDSPSRAAAPTTATFSPRILAPAGGVRRADWLHVQVWKQNGQTGKWDSIYSESELPPTRTTLQLKVPLRQTLRYRLAGYVTSFPNGTRQVDTVWSAEESGFILYDTVPVQRPSGAVARNWAQAPSIPYDTSIVFRPGNPLEIPSPKGQRLAWSETDTVSCSKALPMDSSLRIFTRLDTAVRIWVRTCGTDTNVVPSTPRLHRWKIDTTGIIAQYTPLAPIASGISGFADLARIPAIENAPNQALSFSIPATSVLAWNLKLSAETAAPEVSDFPAAPTASSADARDTGDAITVWTDALKNSLLDYGSGMRVSVTMVRIDTGFGQSWISPPTRFWFRLTPPALPTKFEVVATRWDSVRIDWNLSRTNLTYRAWRAPGTAPVDPTRAIELTSTQIASPSFHLGGLPPDSVLSILLEVRDLQTGLFRREQRSVRTAKLPILPTPFMVTPNSFGAKIKVGTLNTVKVAGSPDSVGRTVSFLWTSTTSPVAATPNPDSTRWPEVPATGAFTSPDGALAPAGSPGQYLFLTVVAVDSSGNRSAPLKQLLEIVADNVDVPPDAPTGLRVKDRTENSVTFAWTNTPGTRAWIRYNGTGLGETIVSSTTTDTTQLVSGLKAGDSLVDVAVQAVDLTNPSRKSAFSAPALNVRTKLPPSAPAKASARWIEDDQGLRLRIRWEHSTDMADQIGWNGIPSSDQIPGSVQWQTPTSGRTGPDSVEIDYGKLPKTAWLAIGVRTIRDGIVGTPEWTPVRIYDLAPDIATLKPRIWQRGDSLFIQLDSSNLGSEYATKVTIDAGVNRIASLDLTGTRGGVDVAKYAGQKLVGTLWLARRTPTNIRSFDEGTPMTEVKSILGAPGDFYLRPGDTPGVWTFTPPTNLASNALVLLVRTNGIDRSARLVVTGDTVIADPSKKDTFQVAQGLDRDTSMLGSAKFLTLLPRPTAMHAPGSYLFPFATTVTANGGALQLKTATTPWATSTGVLSAPFSTGAFQARATGAFMVSPVVDLSYTINPSFSSAAWSLRVSNASLLSSSSPSWVQLDNATAAYVPLNKALVDPTPAYIKFGQSSTIDTGTIWFAVDSTGKSTMDLSKRAGIAFGLLDAVDTTISYTIKVLVATSSGDLEIRIPTVAPTKATQVSAPLQYTLSTTRLPAYSVLATATVIKWTELPNLLVRVKAVGLGIDGRSKLTLRTTVGTEITGVEVLDNISIRL